MPNSGAVNGLLVNGVAGVASIASAVTLAYGVTVGSNIEAEYSIKVVSDVNISYTAVVKVDPVGLGVLYDLKQFNPVGGKDLSLLYASKVAASLSLAYEDLGRAASSVSLEYSALVRVADALAVDYSATTTVAGDLTAPYNLSVNNNVASQVSLNWVSLQASVVNITGVPTITHNGKIIDILSAEVSVDEGNPVWQGNIELAKAFDYRSMKADDPFTLLLGAETFNFIVDSKSTSRAFDSTSYSLVGLSPTVNYKYPRADKITKTWDVDILASDVAADVGMVAAWNTVDWLIPKNRLSVSEADPLSVLLSVAKASGGVVEANPDGTLEVRSEYPVSYLNISGVVPDQVYTDMEDNLEVTESYKLTKSFDKYRVSDTSASYRDTIEYVSSGLASGVLKLYLSPWRNNYLVRTTKTLNISLIKTATLVEQLTETVEFVGGVATLSKPIDSLSSVVWLDTPLGTVAFVAQDNTITAPIAAESLARVTYSARYVAYDVAGLAGDKAQFVVEAT